MVIVKEPVVDKGLLDLVCEERTHGRLKEARVFQFDEEVELMRGIF
jgi:hypothetical protein